MIEEFMRIPSPPPVAPVHTSLQHPVSLMERMK
jgi:hypothetical protein